MRSRAVGPLLGLLVVGMTSSCVGGGRYGMLGAACPQLTGQSDPLQASFSANARADAKIKAFVAAAKSLADVSAQMEMEAAQACERMGADLGIPADQMRARNDDPGAQAKAACGAVGARIEAILREGVQIKVTAVPPRCQANAQAQARCEGVCSAQVTPAEIVAQCEPARLSGYCQGRCVGKCEGTCSGACEGQCSQRDAQGQCAGRCDGTCNGGCDATCHARCEGSWQAPKCEGHVTPPSVDAECTGSCRAQASFTASCDPAQVTVETSANVEQAQRLVATLRANLPQLLHAEIALGKRIIADARVVVNIGAEMPKLVGDAGAQAMACIAAASSASVTASARIQVSIEASASVSGKVGASS